MIQIHKPSLAPEKLRSDGKKERRRNSNLFTRTPDAYTTNNQKFEFKNNIYAHESVKSTLKEIQNSKCCYCERHIKERSTVEHFRPKTSFRNHKAEERQYPGYYWLAYEWKNLYLACETCNSKKNDFFPLFNPDERAINHKSDIHKEKPILIDPGNDDIEKYITFNGEVAVGLDEEIGRGKTTIELVNLNRRTLLEDRLKRLQIIKTLVGVIDAAQKETKNLELQQLASESSKLLKKYTSDDEAFLAAVKCAIAADFVYVL